MQLLWNWCTLYVRGYENKIYPLSRGILNNCLLLWKSALRTVYIFAAVTSNRLKSEDFFLMKWESLIGLTKSKSCYFLFVKYAMCIILSWGTLNNCLLLWKSALGTVDIFAAVTSFRSKSGDFFLRFKIDLLSQQRANHSIFCLSSMQCA